MDTAFDHLWEQEERRALMERLQRDYPVWKRRRRTTLTAMASVVVLVVVGFSIFNFQVSIPKGYDSVACNRGGIADAHWADVAGNILIVNGEL